MALLDTEEKQLTFKFVYCGPPLAGKSSNLRRLQELVDDKNRGRLVTLNGSGDRTLFFDLLPLFFRVSGLSVRIKVYTVPGQPAHRMTRRAVLRGVDGIVFVADSDPAHHADNTQSFDELRDNLKIVGSSLQEVALVTQFNKRDLPGALRSRAFAKEAVKLACAETGKGVLDTFLELAGAVWSKFHQSRDANGLDTLSEDVSREDFVRALCVHIHPQPIDL